MKNYLCLLASFIISLSLLSASSFPQDILVLHGQQVFQGQVKKLKSCEIKFVTESKTYWIPVSDITALQFGDTSNKVFKALQKYDFESCLLGDKDAKVFYKKTGGAFVGGFFLGIIGVGIASLSKPSPDLNTLTNSPNKEYFKDPEYLACYRKGARKKKVSNALSGWGIGLVVSLLIRALINTQ